MKKLLLAAMVALFSVNASAGDVNASAGDVFKHCVKYSTMAGNIMEARQRGVELQRLLEVILTSDMDEDTKAMPRAIILDAFSVPHYSIDKNKTREVVRFKETYLLACLERFTD